MLFKFLLPATDEALEYRKWERDFQKLMKFITDEV